MSVIIKKDSPGGIRIGVWEITEPEDILWKKVRLSPAETAFFREIKSGARRREWLATRALLAKILHLPKGKATSAYFPEILYGDNGKPHLKDSTSGLSISHSGVYVAIAINPSGAQGIDIEHVHLRLKKIAVRFLHESEKAYLKEETTLEQLCLIWCCKESLYKIHHGSNLTFSEHIIIAPFHLDGNTNLTGTIISEGKEKAYRLSYLQINDYYLVYTEN